jgi:hypothetical protein
VPRTNTPPLGLTRDQLATFLKDHEQIKAFENLFAVVEDIAPDVVQQAIIAAGNAQAGTAQALGALTEIAQGLAIQASAAETKAQQALDALAAVRQQVDYLVSAPPPREFKRARYGSFYSTATQTATVINTATAITFNTTDLSSGVRIGTTTSQVIVDTEGIYNFQTSIQLDSTVATAEAFYLWFRKNGVDVTDSASQVRVQGNNAEVFVALNYFFNLKANDYVELMYSVTDLGVQLLASGPVAPHPGIPSVILTVSNNIQGVQ